MIFTETIPVRPGQTIPLGRHGENLARQIVFDISEWRALYGPGSVELIHQRQNDINPYPVTLESSGDKILWTVRSFDTDQVCHYGKAELRYLIGPLSTEQTVVKSAVYQTEVLPALGPPVADAPAAQLDWLAELKETIDTASQNAQTVTDLAADVNVIRTQIAADRQAAARSATAAQTSETNAAQSATDAQTAAQSAAQSQNAAQTAAQSAQTYAANAATAATDAAQSAAATMVPQTRTVNGKALSADVTLNASDVGAADATEQAETDAEQDKKIDILTEILLGMDTTVIRTASGNPVEIDDGANNIPVKNLDVEIPVTQSGSGDPYPSGGNVNLMPYPYKFTELGNAVEYNGITFTDNNGVISVNGTATADAFYRISDERTIDNYATVRSNLFRLPAGNYILSTTESGGLYDTTTQRNSFRIQINTVSGDVVATTAGTTNTGKTYTFTITEEDTETDLRCFIFVANGTVADNVQVYPMIRSADNPDAAWSPYSNVRPFAGVTDVTVTRTGKNLVSILRSANTTNGNVIVRMLGDGRYILSGTRSALPSVTGLNPADNLDNERDRLAEPLFVMKKGVTYYVSGCQITYRTGTPYDMNVRTCFAMYYPSASNPLTVTPSTDWYVKQIRIYLYANTEYDGATVYEPMITTDSGKVWEPYQKQSVTVSTGDAGTVYGGTLDVTTGILTVTWKKIDVRDPEVAKYNNILYFSKTLSPSGISGAENSVFCSALPSVPSLRQDNGCYVNTGGSPLIMSLRDTGIDTAQKFNAWAEENSLQIVYKLASPVTYPLTPQELKTLSGINSITSDAGTVTVSYRADSTMLYHKLLVR